ncbi:hypothetical protein VTO42DRAFT_3287 [Malbranchea cinnamomea]
MPTTAVFEHKTPLIMHIASGHQAIELEVSLLSTYGQLSIMESKTAILSQELGFLCLKTRQQCSIKQPTVSNSRGVHSRRLSWQRNASFAKSSPLHLLNRLPSLFTILTFQRLRTIIKPLWICIDPSGSETDERISARDEPRDFGAVAALTGRVFVSSVLPWVSVFSNWQKRKASESSPLIHQQRRSWAFYPVPFRPVHDLIC